jgi:hypothetical protein
MEECLMSFEFTLYDALVSIDVPAVAALKLTWTL